MRMAVISDIHGNLEALQAVLADIRATGADAVYCLGDVVGYGADPRACLDLVRAQCALTVRGNHEEALPPGDVQQGFFV
ncbi:MAG: metallophosphoesterase, partial [Candidatus Firestonebacteria bacterium]|nr:metallophosphoesterase [Candidatus Firestonebacteria bacterium]